MRLYSGLQASGLDLTVAMRGTDSRVIAGELTETLEASSSPPAGAATLPLGLGGTTLRVRSDSIVRTASGGPVRDVVLPLAPGASWSDRRAGVISDQVIVETRQ